MTVILKLQGLDAQAGTEDIRSFFQEFHIPDGGVYVVGGKLREAFVAFTAERDAQLALRLNGQVLKASKVSLRVSSLEEVEEKLRVMLKKTEKPLTIRKPSSPVGGPPGVEISPCATPPSPPLAPVSPPCEPRSDRPPEPADPQSPNKVDSGTAFLLGCITVLQSLQPCEAGENKDLAKIFSVDRTNNAAKDAASSPAGYVRLFGLPPSVTKEEICEFFGELTVQEVIVNVELGVKHGCLVRFSSEDDASSALVYNKRLLGSSCVEVRGGTEKMWAAAMQSHRRDTWDSRKAPNLPLSENANQQEKPARVYAQRPRVSADSSYPPQKRKQDFETPAPDLEYSVMISNLPETMTKTDIKMLLGCRNVLHRNVLHLLDTEGQRTDKAFVTFHNVDDYEHALGLAGCHVGSNPIEISAISRKRMDLMLRSARLRKSWIGQDS